jgi:hypothetical protein
MDKYQKIDSRIEERARLTFNFYDAGDTKRIALPFFENVTIKESKKSRLAKYDPIGRSSSVFAYLGAQAREIKLSFNITTPLIVERYLTLENRISANKTRSEIVEDYRKLIDDAQTTEGPIDSTVGKFLGVLPDTEKYHYDHDGIDPMSIVTEAAANAGLAALGFPTQNNPINDPKRINRSGQRKGHAAVIEFINLIRSSLVNNVDRPVDGPPIAVLDYGVQYINVPCVVQNYSIAFNDKYGYDLELMLPRVIECSLDLIEVRPSGTLGRGTNNAFKLTGWESTLNDLKRGNNPEVV